MGGAMGGEGLSETQCLAQVLPCLSSSASVAACELHQLGHSGPWQLVLQKWFQPSLSDLLWVLKQISHFLF